MSYQCLIVDDEPIATDIIANYLGRLEGFAIAGKFTNPVKAFEFLQTRKIDLLFLDIQMPGLTGLEFLQSLRRRPEVILTTAFREFALEGFEQDVTDYLLKPITFDRFLKAVGKFQARVSKGALSVQPAVHDDGPPFLFVRADRKQIKILLDDILYLESMKDYVRFVTEKGKITTKQSITFFEEHLPPDRFFRVHRSFIVSKEKITAWSAEGLELGAVHIPIGRQYKQLVEKEMQR
ncbi:MAG: response regulator transcription factor [Saprospiraceae bacterium]|nr:response regulator transcription factor [Saprospiraceae bacterium]